MKFSENFEKWIRKHKTSGRMIVAFSRYSLLDGSDLEYDSNKTQASNILIGFGAISDGYLHGSRLSEIICSGARAKFWAFGPQYKLEKLYGWLEHYNNHGVCQIDPEHILYSNWVMDSDDERHCEYCGHKQIRKTVMLPKHSWHAKGED